MKKGSLFLSFIFLALISCDKQLYDIRTRYIGDYHFITYYHDYDDWGHHSYDTGYYDGKIEKDSEDDKVRIPLWNNLVLKYHVFEDGSVGYINPPIITGEFITYNYIYFIFKTQSVDRHIECQIMGEKILK